MRLDSEYVNERIAVIRDKYQLEDGVFKLVLKSLNDDYEHVRGRFCIPINYFEVDDILPPLWNGPGREAVCSEAHKELELLSIELSDKRGDCAIGPAKKTPAGEYQPAKEKIIFIKYTLC
jgi:hypothetical protein